MTGHLRTSDQDDTRVLTIDRPESKNALHGPLRAELIATSAAADHDDRVRVVILTAVDPVFSAGVDFKQLEPGPGESVWPAGHHARQRAARDAHTRHLRGQRCVCVRCAGNRAQLFVRRRVGARPLRRYSRTARRRSHRGMTALLPRAVGVRKARQMSITGEFVYAAEALRLGLVNQVVSHEELLPVTLELAGRVPATAAVGEMLRALRRRRGSRRWPARWPPRRRTVAAAPTTSTRSPRRAARRPPGGGTIEGARDGTSIRRAACSRHGR